MSAEETIAALCRGTVDVVRRSLREATAEALVEDYSDALRKVLRQAYEVGYREGLARAGHPTDGTSSADNGKMPIAADAMALAEETPPTFNGDDRGLAADDDDVEPEAETDADSADTSVHTENLRGDDLQTSPHASCSPMPTPLDWGREGGADTVVVRRREPSRDTAALRIFPHATVGTLLQRIHDYFDLERFDIDVVVCRKGDRARRQLKKSVRLAKYEVGE